MRHLKYLEEISSNENRINDLNNRLKKDLSVEKVSDFATIAPNIMGEKQLPMALSLKVNTMEDTGCSPEFFDVEQTFLQQWNPKSLILPLRLCYKDLRGSIMAWSVNKGVDIANLEGTDYLEWLMGLIKQAKDEAVLSQALFSHENMEDSILSDPKRKEHYKVVEKGLLPTLQYFKSLDRFKDQFVDIDRNQKETLSDQMSLPKGYARGIFEKLEEKGAEIDLPEGAVFLVSNSLFRNYVKDFFIYNPALESAQKNIIEGIASSAYFGIPIKPLMDYDRIVREDFIVKKNNVTKAYTPHFALLTSKENILIGVNPVASLEDLSFQYIGGNDNHLYIKGGYALDVKIADPSKIAAAF